MASIQKRTDGGWRGRYRDAAGREHAKHFRRKVDAQNWLDGQTTAILTGQWADPRAGKITVREYGDRWQEAQTWRPKTRERVASSLKVHVYPRLGDRAIGSIRRSEVQAFVKHLSVTLGEPSTVAAVYSVLRGMMRAAVVDLVIAVSPCNGVSAPSAPPKALTIPSAADVAALAAALPERYSPVPYVAAGLGLRPGECLGLKVEDVDFLGRRVSVRQQLDEHRQLVPLKTDHSYRTIPLPDVISIELAEHLRRTGRRESGLLFLDANGRPPARNSFEKTWRRAVEQAGLARGLRLHDLRHAYASALIQSGQSVKVIQLRMGHASAMVTLDVYGHLWPDSDDDTRSAVDAYLASPGNPADSVRTAEASPQVSGLGTDYLEKA
ncbi:MAG: tyrosine-type recombinase/integrase [Propionibacteriales bacterium]|nr:tyrosine-type recombinase/integrase [Propionibacteriales bacterium]